MGTIAGSAPTADPKLGPLQDNGGPTATIAPAAGSAAIDAGLPFGLTTDQRGLPRPAGNGADIDAVERQLPGSGGGAAGGAGSHGSRRAFGKRTLVRLRLAIRRIAAKGRCRSWSPTRTASASPGG
jgi:hypothetical protein